MSAIIKQHSTSQPDLTRQFQKLFIQRLLAENFLVFLLQYSGLMLSTLTSQAMPLWLASGTACGFIFLRGYSVLPGIFAGSFFAYFFANSGFDLACACAGIYCLQAFLLVYISQTYISPTLLFHRKINFLKFIAYLALLTAAISTAIEFLCLSSAASLKIWIQWWLADFNGIFILACALIALDAYFPQLDALKELNRTRLFLFFGLLIFFISAILMSHTALQSIGFSVAASLLIMQMGKFYGWCGAITGIFLLGFAFTLAAFFGMALFAANTTLVYLQLILGLQVISLLNAIPNSA